MSERRDFDCGCAFVQPTHQSGTWYQVVACPEHVMDMLPKAEPFVTARKAAQ